MMRTARIGLTVPLLVASIMASMDNLLTCDSEWELLSSWILTPLQFLLVVIDGILLCRGGGVLVPTGLWLSSMSGLAIINVLHVQYHPGCFIITGNQGDTMISPIAIVAASGWILLVVGSLVFPDENADVQDQVQSFPKEASEGSTRPVREIAV